jgi:acyl carrier protein
LDKLGRLAREWEAGAEVDWAAVFLSPANLVDLPRYPFQGRAYWLDAPPAGVVENAGLASRTAEASPTAQGPAAQMATAQWLEPLRQLSPIERRYRLLDFVGSEVRQVFGMTPEDAIDESHGLFDLGMDSLMSVGLKQRLESGTGLQLPDTLILTYSSVADLAEYLDGKLFPPKDAPAVEPQEASSPILFAPVADMDEAETNAAIAAELAAIQQKLGAL